MRTVILAVILLAVGNSHASELQAAWQPSWDVDVHRLWCGLQRYYRIARTEDPEKRGALTGTAYYGMWLTFRVNTRSHGAVIPQSELNRLQFWLTLSADQQARTDSNEVVGASIGGFGADRVLAEPAHLFSLKEEEARAIFDGFDNEQPAEITLKMANGEVRQILLPNIPPGYFAVYSAMLQTCVNENRD